MAEKKQQQADLLANGYARSDTEAATANPEELRRQKRKKWLIYGLAFVVFQTAIIVLFSLTVMKVKTPKFRVRSGTWDSPVLAPGDPPFTAKMNVQFAVKNTNFGPYKYDNSTVYIYYDGIQVGSAVIPKSKAKFLSTQKFDVAVDLTNVSSNSNLAAGIRSGSLNLTMKSTLSGKVELMLILKKKKTVDLSCTIYVEPLKSRLLENVKCE